MYCATIVWAYDDMDLARRLWPRVKTAVEEQVNRDNLEMDVGRQRQVIAAIVNDLMEKQRPQKRHWCSPKSISKLLHLFRRPNPMPVQAAIPEPVAMPKSAPVPKPKTVSKKVPMSKPRPASKSAFMSKPDSLPKPGPVPNSSPVPAGLSAARR